MVIRYLCHPGKWTKKKDKRNKKDQSKKDSPVHTGAQVSPPHTCSSWGPWLHPPPQLTAGCWHATRGLWSRPAGNAGDLGFEGVGTTEGMPAALLTEGGSLVLVTRVPGC